MCIDPKIRTLFMALLLVSGICGVRTVGAGEDAPSLARRGELIQLLERECGSCHGATLAGGMGPSLLPEILSERDTEGIINVILDGRPGTAMPPWRPFLSEGEARWLATRLQAKDPE